MEDIHLAVVPGEPLLEEGKYQYAYTEENPTNYTGTVTNIIDNFYGKPYHELATRENPDGVASAGTDGLNAIAKDLAGYVKSVKDNGGYYLARYEASYGSGYNASGSNDTAKYENAKPLSQPSKNKSDSSMNYNQKTLWNYITQINASKVCRNMYSDTDETKGVKSDLVNSYAWDTAIVYIQEMKSENANFANKRRGDVGDISTLANTGSNSADKFCNIYDMVANTREWTTEYSTNTHSSTTGPCVPRGGYYYNTSNFTAGRNNGSATGCYGMIGFRPILYVTD